MKNKCPNCGKRIDTLYLETIIREITDFDGEEYNVEKTILYDTEFLCPYCDGEIARDENDAKEFLLSELEIKVNNKLDKEEDRSSAPPKDL